MNDSMRILIVSSQVMQKRVLNNPKIRTLMNYRVSRWLGSGTTLRGAHLHSTNNDSTQEVRGIGEATPTLELLIDCSQVACDGAFIAIGHTPKTDFLDGQVGTGTGPQPLL